MHKFKEKLKESLFEIEKKIERTPDTKLTMADIQSIHMITDTIKNIDKIEKLEEGGYSQAEWSARGSYDDPYNYSRDGYSGNYDNHSYEGESYRRRRDNMGRYSRDSGKEHMIHKLEEMLTTAEDGKQREAIHRCLKELKE